MPSIAWLVFWSQVLTPSKLINMPAPEGNKYAVKAEENRVAFPKAPIRGTKAERQAWNQAQAKSGLGWNDFGRQALNAAAGYVPSEPANDPLCDMPEGAAPQSTRE